MPTSAAPAFPAANVGAGAFFVMAQYTAPARTTHTTAVQIPTLMLASVFANLVGSSRWRVKSDCRLPGARFQVDGSSGTRAIFRMFRILFCIAALAIPSLATAEVRASYAEGGRTLFSFDVPDFWDLRSGGRRSLTLPGTEEARDVPQVLSLRPTVDPTVWMAFYSPDGVRNIEEGKEYLREIGEFLSSQPEIAANRSGRVGGRTAQIIKGTGRRDGKNIQFTIAIIDLPGPRVAIGAAVAEAGTDPAFYDALNAVYDSFRASP